jgi:hypothetical protein
MKNMTAVIQEVARRTGKDEALVEKIIRNAESDCRDFLTEKKGYSLWFPNLGTFTFRVSFIAKYVEIQRRHLAYWKYRLTVGTAKENSRTIIAAQENIIAHTFRIKQALIIKSEYLDQHCTYNKNKVAYMERTAVADIDRLDQLLDVAALVEAFKAEHQAKAGDLPELPLEKLLPDIMVSSGQV